jgi:hypothetical protein
MQIIAYSFSPVSIPTNNFITQHIVKLKNLKINFSILNLIYQYF